MGQLIRCQKFVSLRVDSKDRECEITIVPLSEADHKA